MKMKKQDYKRHWDYIGRADRDKWRNEARFDIAELGASEEQIEYLAMLYAYDHALHFCAA